MSRLPTPGGDEGSWGDVLNDFLSAEHNADGTLKLRSDGTLTAKESTANKGQANGYAGLDGTGKVPSTQLPAGSSVSDATSGAKGIVQLAGDLGGSAASPTVPSLANKVDTSDARLTDSRNLKAPTTSVSFNSQKITNLATPTSGTDGANKSYVDGVTSTGGTPDADATTKGKVALAGDLSGTAALPTVPALTTKVDTSDARLTDARDLKTPSANVSLNSFKITSLGLASSGTDAANKNYVDFLLAFNKTSVSENDNTPLAFRPLINFLDGAGISIAAADDSANNQTNVTITNTSSGGGGSNAPRLVNAGTVSTNQTLDMTGFYDCKWRVTLGANNIALAISNLAEGASVTLVLKQDATGNRTVGSVLPAAQWESGTEPTPSLSANAKDVYTFYNDGTAIIGGVFGQLFS